MLKSIVRVHTVILAVASIVLLIAPGRLLEAFGITNASFAVLSLTRVLAGLIATLATAIYPLPDLPLPVRSKALSAVATAYFLLTALIVAQQVAIWSNVAGMLLSAECLLHAGAFAWLAVNERKVLAAGA
jgi:hypothetical protein